MDRPSNIKNQFKKVSQIIEQDSKVSTYKFALLRATIEIIQQNDHLKEVKNNRVNFPFGLLVEKWLLYYYPIFANNTFLPQMNGETKEPTKGRQLAFRKHFNPVIAHYEDYGGFPAFFEAVKAGEVAQPVNETFVALVKEIRQTIAKQPMRYIGYSLHGDHYTIYREETNRERIGRDEQLDIEDFIDRLGTFSIPEWLYEVLLYTGSFISGMDALLFKWASFTVNLDKEKAISEEQVLNELLKSPLVERAVHQAQAFYRNQLDELKCVWSGKGLTDQYLHVDHCIPFSVWRNNDLWNLLPTHQDINHKKGDKIPSRKLLEDRKDLIIHYWEQLHQQFSPRFLKEIKVSLTGPSEKKNWKNKAFQQLQHKCEHLIEIRGREKFYI